MWPFAAPPPPPPPSALEVYAPMLTAATLAIGLPLLFLLSQGVPYAETAKPLKSTTIVPMKYRDALVEATRKSLGVFVAFVVITVVLDILLRLTACGDLPTATKVHGGANEVDESSRSLMADVVAYNLASLGFASYSSYIGLTTWFDGRAAAIGKTRMDRLYAHSPIVERLCVLVAGYEAFNFLAVIKFAEYRSFAFIGHHVVTLALGVMSLHPWCHFYSAFFFGVASTSSIPLCVGEMLSALDLAALSDHTKAPFVLLFFVIRTAYWPYVSLGFWRDCLWALSAPSKRVHSFSAYALLLCANIFLTGLQVYWTSQIVDAIFEMVAGK